MTKQKESALGASAMDGIREREARNPELARLTKDKYDGAQLVRKLKAAREKAGLTQAQAATRSGMKQPAVARVERGEHLPGLTTLQRLAAVYGLRLKVELEESRGGAR